MLRIGEYEGTGFIKKIEVRKIKGEIIECMYTYATLGTDYYRHMPKSIVEGDIKGLDLKFTEYGWD